MNLHLAEIGKAVAPAAHAILLVDQAGWHLSNRLVVPANITILPLPPKCPELNPVECLAVHARQLAFQPRLQILRRSRRSLLPGLEQLGRSALAHHVHRTAPIGSQVLINEIWYKPSQRDPAAAIEDGEPAGDRHFPGESRGCGLRHGHSRRRERAADPTGIDDGSARAPIGQAAARQRS